MEETNWRTDPQGNVFKVIWDDISPRVIYKVIEPKRSFELKPFIVKVRGETFHVEAVDEEATALVFWSETFPHYPKRSEIEVILQEAVSKRMA